MNMMEKDFVFRRLKGQCQEMNFIFEGPKNPMALTMFGFLFVNKIQYKFSAYFYYLLIYKILPTTLFKKHVPA